MTSQCEQRQEKQPQIIFIMTVPMQERISMLCATVGGRLDFK